MAQHVVLKVKLVILVILCLTIATVYHVASASGCDNCNNESNITNVYNDHHYYGDEVYNLVNGVSNNDFGAALAQSYASGAHELDFSTTQWQLSATAVMQYNGNKEEAVSFKLGKKFDILPEALLHITINPKVTKQGSSAIFGGTIRF